MKRNKTIFIIFQLLLIIGINYFFLIDSGFIHHEQLATTFSVAIVFFHAGMFLSLLIIFNTKVLTKEKLKVLEYFNEFILVGFLALLFFHECSISTPDLAANYILGLAFLFGAISSLRGTYISYLHYNTSNSFIHSNI